MRGGIPLRFKTGKQLVARGSHLIVVEDEDRLHMGRGGFRLGVEGLEILVDGEIERGIQGLMLPRLRKLVFVFELARARHLPPHQSDGHQEGHHLSNTVVAMAYLIEKILYSTHNQMINNIAPNKSLC